MTPAPGWNQVGFRRYDAVSERTGAGWLNSVMDHYDGTPVISGHALNRGARAVPVSITLVLAFVLGISACRAGQTDTIDTTRDTPRALMQRLAQALRYLDPAALREEMWIPPGESEARASRVSRALLVPSGWRELQKRGEARFPEGAFRGALGGGARLLDDFVPSNLSAIIAQDTLSMEGDHALVVAQPEGRQKGDADELHLIRKRDRWYLDLDRDFPWERLAQVDRQGQAATGFIKAVERVLETSTDLEDFRRRLAPLLNNLYRGWAVPAPRQSAFERSSVEPRPEADLKDLIGLAENKKVTASIRLQSVQQLARYSTDQNVLKTLVSALRTDPDVTVRDAAARALGQSGDDEVSKILTAALLRDNNWIVRRTVCRALSGFHVSTTRAALEGVLGNDPNPFVRSEAAHSLGRFGDPKAVPALKRALEDDTLVPEIGSDGRITRVRVVVREASARALRTLGQPPGEAGATPDWVAVAVSHLADPKRKEADRARSAWMLGLSRDMRAVEPLVAALANDKTPLIQRASAKALGTLGDSRALQPLVRTMNRGSSAPVREAALKGLALLGDPAAAPAIHRAVTQRVIPPGPAARVLAGLK